MLCTGGLALLDALFGMAASQTIYFLGSKSTSRYGVIQRALGMRGAINLCAGVALALLSIANITSGDSGNTAIFWFTIVVSGIIYIAAETSRASAFTLIHLFASSKRYAFQATIDSLIHFSLTSAAAIYTRRVEIIILAIVAAKLLSLYIAGRASEQITKLPLAASKEIGESGDVSWHEITSHARALSTMGFIGWCSGFADRYVIAIGIGTISAGHYAVATGIATRIFGIISSTLTSHFRPRIFLAIGEGNPQAAKHATGQWIRVALFAGIIVFGAILLLREIIAHLLLGPSARESVATLLPIAAASLCITVLIHAIDNFYLASGRNSALIKMQIFSIVFTFICVIGLGAQYGIVGAATGKLISEFAKLAICTIGLRFASGSTRKR